MYNTFEKKYYHPVSGRPISYEEYCYIEEKLRYEDLQNLNGRGWFFNKTSNFHISEPIPQISESLKTNNLLLLL